MKVPQRTPSKGELLEQARLQKRYKEHFEQTLRAVREGSRPNKRWFGRSIKG